MDAATIQAKIYAGRAKAAQRIGFACDLYRPLAANAPLGNKVTTIKAAFNAGDSTYRAPNLPGDAIWYGDFDGRLTQPGDYLVRQVDGGVYYVAGQQPLLPIICVEANRAVTIGRQSTAQTSVGAIDYGGSTADTETIILGSPTAKWPASILFGSRSQQGAGVPSGVKNSGWRIMLPPSVPVTIRAGDIVTDDLGRRFAVDGAEQTDLGWRINAQEVHT